MYNRLSKTPSSINTNSQAAEQNPKLAYRPFGSQIQKASVAPVTQTDIEDEAFAEQKFEATGLELQAKYGKITPEGQERLTVLQAKMDELLNSPLERATRFSHNFANIPIRSRDTATPIQAKLTIGEPGDKYEQEADETARQVVQRIHQPQSDKLQGESLPEDELQMKPMVQRRVSDGGMAATQDLEASINQARGGGQPLAKNIRKPMELGFGADFSRVKVHTDTRADQLNRSIQAKAFTTGQDVFFRQGAYEPGSRGGQELLAHELTHVVQQSGGAVQRSLQKNVKSNQNLLGLAGKEWIQQTGDEWSGERGLARDGKDMEEKGKQKTRDISQLDTRSLQLKVRETGNSIITIETRTARESTRGGVIQREFAVEVTVGREAVNEERKITEVRFGDRPNTQFGAKQEDHVTAWAIKCEEIRHGIIGKKLKDAVGPLITIMDDTNGIMLNNTILETIESLAESFQTSKDDLDLQQAMQTSTRMFLVAYNADPKATRQRVGSTDRTEGARVKNAKNEIRDKYGKLSKDIDDKDLEEFVVALGNTFQYSPNQTELNDDKNKNYPELTNAIALILISGFNLISESTLSRHLKEIAIKFLHKECDKLGLTVNDRKIILKKLKSNHRVAAFFE